MAVLFAMGFRASARKAMPSEVALEFYPGELEDLVAWNREIEEKVTKNGGKYDDVNEPPGEGTIYVRVGGSIVASYRARGGPPSAVNNGEHVAVPTTLGTYTLGEGHAHVTSNWYYSQIPWGAEIRAQEGGYQYRWAGGTSWAWATNHPAGTLKEPIAADEFENLPEVTREGVTYFLWNKNDFGPVAWNVVPSDQYVHTTPKAEAERAKAADAGPNVITSLTASHGCIHLDPRERDEMVARGYLAKDVLFVVRRWDEHLLPDEIRREMINPTAVGSLRESITE